MLTGLSSLGVALIAWLQASRTTRLNAQAKLDLEKFKAEKARDFEMLKAQLAACVQKDIADREMRLKAYETACQEVARAEIAINVCWERIQGAKSEMRFFLRALPHGPPAFHFLLRDIEKPLVNYLRAIDTLDLNLPHKARSLAHLASHPILGFIENTKLLEQDSCRTMQKRRGWRRWKPLVIH